MKCKLVTEAIKIPAFRACSSGSYILKLVQFFLKLAMICFFVVFMKVRIVSILQAEGSLLSKTSEEVNTVFLFK